MAAKHQLITTRTGRLKPASPVWGKVGLHFYLTQIEIPLHLLAQPQANIFLANLRYLQPIRRKESQITLARGNPNAKHKGRCWKCNVAYSWQYTLRLAPRAWLYRSSRGPNQPLSAPARLDTPSGQLTPRQLIMLRLHNTTLTSYLALDIVGADHSPGNILNPVYPNRKRTDERKSRNERCYLLPSQHR